VSELAVGFATCTRWFCSVPGETWPNRQFVHAGTSAGTVNNELRTYEDRTIFQDVEEAVDDPQRDWRIYYDGPAQVLCYPALWQSKERAARWFVMEDLFRHLRAGDLPAYAFVEPNHGYLGRSYSQHPGNNKKRIADFARGDRFVAAVYEALRENMELFVETLLVVTYDEHGGTFDHVPPHRAVAPDVRRTSGFDFSRYGPRVPAILVSPWIPQGSVLTKVFDHSSIPATVRALFARGTVANSEREKRAESFFDALSLSAPRTELPTLTRRPYRPKAAWAPIKLVHGWLRALVNIEDDMLKSLAWLVGVVDEAIPEPPGVRARLRATDAILRTVAPPRPPGAINRPLDAAVMSRFEQRAAAARTGKA